MQPLDTVHPLDSSLEYIDRHSRAFCTPSADSTVAGIWYARSTAALCGLENEALPMLIYVWRALGLTMEAAQRSAMAWHQLSGPILRPW